MVSVFPGPGSSALAESQTAFERTSAEPGCAEASAGAELSGHDGSGAGPAVALTDTATPPAICFACGSLAPPVASRCPACASPRLLIHPELHQLKVAHVDCDAFFAAVEKRDRPELATKPVAIGGGRRGVVAAACYIARIRGVRSAMPMFKALKLCPDLVVIKPDFSKYKQAGQQIRAWMRELTPDIQPISIDEAFMDFRKIGGLDRPEVSPATQLTDFSRRIREELNLTVSVGLSHNKLMAKIASDQDKPRGFCVIGRAETENFLEDKPVRILWGVGPATERSLRRRGITTVGALRRQSEQSLGRHYGVFGPTLHNYARGVDARSVKVRRDASKSVSAETTFFEDSGDPAFLAEKLAALCDRVTKRLRKEKLAGRTVTVKLKTADFKSRTRAQSLVSHTCLADVMDEAAQQLLARELEDGTQFRLIGVGLSDLCDIEFADPYDLADPTRARKKELALLRDMAGMVLDKNHGAPPVAFHPGEWGPEETEALMP